MLVNTLATTICPANIKMSPGIHSQPDLLPDPRLSGWTKKVTAPRTLLETGDEMPF